MKKNKIIILTLAACTAVASFSGCSVKTDTPIIGKIAGLDKNEIFQIDDLICSREEYMLVFMNTQNKYKENLGSGIDWDAKVARDTTLKDALSSQVKEEITAYYTLASMAKRDGVTLSESEKTNVTAAANDFYNSMTDEEKKYTGASSADVANLYTNYYLAEKQKERITKNAGSDVSDEQARVIKIQYIHMSENETESKKIKSTLKKVTQVVNGGYQEFSREAKQYSIDDSIEKTVKKNKAKKIHEMEAFELNSGEISNIIQDGKDYYLIYCIDSYMKKETAQNKKDIIKETKEKILKQIYDEYLEEVSSDYNTSAWKEINVSENKNVTTTKLMEVYEKYL